jgi:hypothetical protein
MHSFLRSSANVRRSDSAPNATPMTLRLTGYDQKRQFKRVTEEVIPTLA